jgi:hypothetical protein
VLTLFARILLFISAFTPLFVIWALRVWPSPGAVIFVLLGVIGAIGAGAVIFVTHSDEGQPTQIDSVEERQSDVAAYLVTYLIPFVTAPVQTVQDWLAVTVFVSLLLVLYVTSDLISINPLLALAGLTLYRVKLRDLGAGWLLSEFRPTLGSALSVAQMADAVYVSIRKLP